MTVSNLHGWSQTPPGGGGWRFSIGGAIDAPGQVIDLNANTKVSGAQAPLAIALSRGGLSAASALGGNREPQPFPAGADSGHRAQSGLVVIPADFRFDGTADGAVGYSIPEGSPAHGRRAERFQLDADRSGRAAAPSAERRACVFPAVSIKLEAAEIRNDSNETAAIQGDWDIESQKVRCRAFERRHGDRLAAPADFGGGDTAAEPCDFGHMEGRSALHRRRMKLGVVGEINLADADIPLEAFAAPVHLVSADATIDGAGLVAEARRSFDRRHRRAGRISIRGVARRGRTSSASRFRKRAVRRSKSC